MAKQNSGYQTTIFEHEISLRLSANESRCVIDDLDQQLASLDQKFVSQYPSHAQLQALIGQWIGVDSDRVVVTAGGDDSIERLMRTLLTPTRNKVVTHAPSFEMVDIYCRNYRGQMAHVTWLEGNFPAVEFESQLDSATALAVITSPNNPTGGWVDADTILAINETAKSKGIMLLVDLAYVEFAPMDPTLQFAADPNIVMVRTFSKAFGLAGLRVGYLVAPNADFANSIRNAAGPFPVSAASLELARRALADYLPAMQANVHATGLIRGLVVNLIKQCGGESLPSSGNFVLAEFADAEKVWAGLAADGIGVRKYPQDSPLLANRLRITCPVLPGDFLRLAKSLIRVAGGDTDSAKARYESQIVALGMAIQTDHVQGEAGPAVEAPAVADGIGDTPDQPATDDVVPRVWQLARETKETNIEVDLNLDGSGIIEIETGIGFLDHMLTALAFHSGMDLTLKCVGDLHVDDHHTAEDCAIALATAIDGALGKRTGIKRFGYAYAPLDEALARTVIDLSGRPWPEVHLQLEREMVGTWACENITHFFHSLAMTLKCSLHVDVLRGFNDHHRAEAAFKSCAKALKEALTRTTGDVPSTKGVL